MCKEHRTTCSIFGTVFFLCLICTHYYETLLRKSARSRCADGMLPVRAGYLHAWPFGKESACNTGRWALGCSETVMVNM